VATASAAIAAAHGYPDGECIPVELMLAAIGRIATAVDLPTTADLELGYGDVDTTIRRAVQLGVAGANLEDALRPLPTAVRIVEQALRAGAAEGVPLVLNAHRPLPAARGLAAGCAARRDPPARPGVPRRRSRLRVRARLHRPRRNLHPREQFGPGRLSLLAVPGLPLPGTCYGSVSPGCPTARHRTGTPWPPSPTWQPVSTPPRPSTTRHHTGSHPARPTD